MIGGTGDEVQMIYGAGAYETAEAIDAIKIAFANGNIESGDIDLYGLTK